jgi:hypothetical protein
MSTPVTVTKTLTKSKKSAPVAEVITPVAAPSVVVETAPPVVNEPVKTKKPRAKKAEAEVVAAPVETPAPIVQVAAPVAAVQAPVQTQTQSASPAPLEDSVIVDDEKRQRPKLRAFEDVFSELSTSVTESYNLLQNAKRGLKSLQSAHNREVHNTTKTRESASRTPTIVFDQELVNYFRSRLPVSLLKVTRKGEEFDLSGLNTQTRVHRTDVTQLYTAVFKHQNMQNPADRRNVLYMQDPALVALLTGGSLDASLLDDVKLIKDGSYKLTIFNIQRFTNQHLGKVLVSSDSLEVAVSAVAL